VKLRNKNPPEAEAVVVTTRTKTRKTSLKAKGPRLLSRDLLAVVVEEKPHQRKTTRRLSRRDLRLLKMATEVEAVDSVEAEEEIEEATVKAVKPVSLVKIDLSVSVSKTLTLGSTNSIMTTLTRNTT